MKHIFVIILAVEFIIGNLVNGFIALVNCMDYVKRRKISSVDQIVTALAISRIVLLWLVVINILSTLMNSVKLTIQMVRMYNNTWVVLNHFNLWFSTNLGIFYALKVVNFSNSLFLYLKRRAKKVISVTLVLSLVLLFLNAALINAQIDVFIDGSKRNLSYDSNFSINAQLYKLLLSTNSVFACIPFIVSLTAFLLLIISLWRHCKKMQHYALGCRDASTTAHIRALQTGTAFLLVYVIFLLCIFMQIWVFELLGEHIFILLGMTVGLAFPLGHSCVMVLGNGKLRQAAVSALRWLMARAEDTGSSGH